MTGYPPLDIGLNELLKIKQAENYRAKRSVIPAIIRITDRLVSIAVFSNAPGALIVG